MISSALQKELPGPLLEDGLGVNQSGARTPVQRLWRYSRREIVSTGKRHVVR